MKKIILAFMLIIALAVGAFAYSFAAISPLDRCIVDEKVHSGIMIWNPLWWQGDDHFYKRICTIHLLVDQGIREYQEGR